MSIPSFKTSSSTTARFIIPPGWFAVVSAVFRKDAKQAMIVSSKVKGGIALFQSDAALPNSSLQHQLEASEPFPVAPRDKPISVDLCFFRPDPDAFEQPTGSRRLIKPEFLVHNVTVVPSFKQTLSTKEVPDYMTYHVFVEDPSIRDSTQAPGEDVLNSAVAIIVAVRTGSRRDASRASSVLSAGTGVPTIPTIIEPQAGPSTELATPVSPVERRQPPPPPPANVVKGYNKALDAPRPVEITSYMQLYDTVFLVDDSGSMGERGRWGEACKALRSILHKAIDKNAGGISLYFFNSVQSIELKGVSQERQRAVVEEVLGKVLPSGGTPIGERISAHLGRRLDLLDTTAPQTPQYAAIKPLDLVVLTDGVPPPHSIDPRHQLRTVLLDTATRLRLSRHHPNAVSVRFVQVDQDPQLRTEMDALARLDTNGMVDTIPYEGAGSLTPEKLDRILVGGAHPNMRTQAT